MGRGRAKAKQTKVARKLKYSSGGTDLARLQAELAGSSAVEEQQEEPEDDFDDPYARFYDGDEDEAEDDAASS